MMPSGIQNSVISGYEEENKHASNVSSTLGANAPAGAGAAHKLVNRQSCEHRPVTELVANKVNLVSISWDGVQIRKPAEELLSVCLVSK